MAGPEDAGLRLLGGTDALERWKQSLDRFWLSRGSVCAPLDVADRKASIPPTGSPTRSSVALRGSASASQAFDGSPVQQASKRRRDHLRRTHRRSNSGTAPTNGYRPP